MKRLVLLFTLLTLPLFAQDIKYVVVEIDSGVAVSDSVDLQDYRNGAGLKLIAIIGDTAWTSAGITFMGWSPLTTSVGMWSDIYQTDGSTALSASFSDSIYVTVEPKYFAGVRYLKIRSGTNTVPVKQTTTSATRPRRLRLVLTDY